MCSHAKGTGHIAFRRCKPVDQPQSPQELKGPIDGGGRRDPPGGVVGGDEIIRLHWSPRLQKQF